MDDRQLVRWAGPNLRLVHRSEYLAKEVEM